MMLVIVLIYLLNLIPISRIRSAWKRGNAGKRWGNVPEKSGNVSSIRIWQHADQNRTGFLGRQEFFNALKLVTVAQTQPNPMASCPPTQQPGVVNTIKTQNFGIRPLGPPSVAPPSAQYFAPQGNQSMRPPPQSGLLPSQGVGGLASPGLGRFVILR
ncbi:epidermal growth factor receptor substrate 15-like protein 1 [Tanacetum coccineum]